jgi:hypothetical protein
MNNKSVWGWIGVIGAVIIISSLGSSAKSEVSAFPAVSGTAQVNAFVAPEVSTVVVQPGGNLSNNSYYKNSAGNQIHSPAYSNDGNIPAGATAQCRDGTYSFSASRRGTCSHHGGVAKWL